MQNNKGDRKNSKLWCHEENEINECLNSDIHDPRYQMLNDNETVEEIQDKKK